MRGYATRQFEEGLEPTQPVMAEFFDVDPTLTASDDSTDSCHDNVDEFVGFIMFFSRVGNRHEVKGDGLFVFVGRHVKKSLFTLQGYPFWSVLVRDYWGW